MFNDQQNDQTQTNTDIDTVAQEINNQTPPLGLGGNPTNFTPPNDNGGPNTTTLHTAPTANDALVDTSAQNSSQTSAPAINTAGSSSGDLESIKHDALEQLSPLVDKLDQPPEEKYKTIMMLIQASDNPALIKSAYDAANAITDETVKAEALLAVVNEINYLTQQKQ